MPPRNCQAHLKTPIFASFKLYATCFRGGLVLKASGGAGGWRFKRTRRVLRVGVSIGFLIGLPG